MSLSRLVEMQKAAKAAKENGGESKEPMPPVPETAAAQESGAEPALPTPAPAPNPKRLPFGNPTPKPSTAVVSAKPKESLSLDNLGSFDLSSVDDPEPNSDIPEEFAGFHDEIEATAPDRDLPEDLTAAQLGFVESLDAIYGILNDSELFGQQIRQIMMELQENPEYEKLISDTDVHVMIRAMRNTMGLARVRKQVKKRSTSTGTKARTPSKKQALMDKALALSTGFGISLD